MVVTDLVVTPTSPLWAIVPAIDLVEMALQTCEDLLAQSVPTRVLLVDQGSSEESNDRFREFAEQHHPRVLLWSFNPALPSLSACWNRALRFVWEVGGEEALVCNSDIRLHRDTAKVLNEVTRTTDALFVSALGVGADQFRQEEPVIDTALYSDHGGPDFSCFLLTKEGHARYHFDEGFVPAFCEDLDAHRRYLLGGDGARIFSVNLPFHHIRGGSRTINQSPEARARFERLAGIGRAHYQAKWGGPVNRETFTAPFSGDPWPNVTTPELQARVQAGLLPLDGVIRARAEAEAVVGEVLYQRELTTSEAEEALARAFQKKAEELPRVD